MILGGTIIDCEHLKMLPVILIYERVANKKKALLCGICLVISSRFECVCRVG